MRKSAISLLVVGCFLTTSIFDGGSANAQSVNDIDQKINSLEEKQRKLESEQGNLSSEKESTESELSKNENQQQSVKEEMQEIDNKLAETSSSIANKESEINKTNQEIETLTEEINNLKDEINILQERIAKRETLLKNRLQSIQENGGNMKYIEVILEAQTFADFISRSSAVNVIMDQDKQIMEEHKADKQLLESKQVEVENKRAEVESKKLSLESQRKELLTLKSQLDKQMSEKEAIKSKLEEKHEELEDHKMSIEEEQEVLREQARIVEQAKNNAQSQKQKMIEESQKPKSSSSSSGNSSSAGGSSNQVSSGGGGGTFIWPTSGSISSGFGPRSFNGGGFHHGIDIAAPQGTPVYAAANGVVTRADFSSSYGNVVYVYHPDINKTTVYAHLHSISTSAGANVSQGQNIGGVGNTGRSFGNHLHFEVHNGLWSQKGGVNPMPYLK